MSLKIRNQNTHTNKNFLANSNTQSEKLIQQGKDLLARNQYDSAISKFKESAKLNKTNPEPFFDIARAYTYKKDYKNAITYYDQYLTKKPDNIEAITMQGECYKNLGLYKKAQNNFKKAIEINNKYDYAQRNLKECQNYEKFIHNPQKAIQEKEEQIEKNLKTALNYAHSYFPKNYMNSIKHVDIAFDKTSSMGGRSNIAQYEYTKQKITITDDFIWASPEVVGAYLIHECVHAKDNDPYTSVREEQDAFETATKFWIKNSKGIQDPELDYATELYQKSPQTLANRVKEIYKARDPSISMTSPNHPPQATNATKLSSQQINSSNLKRYDVIA